MREGETVSYSGESSVVPPLTDPDRLAAFLDAMRNWAIRGYIEFDLSSTARKYVRETLGIGSLDELSRLMHQFVTTGGCVDEIRELRPEWCPKWEFHYDLRIQVNNRVVYIETRLIYRLPVVADESSILVVNIHDA
jgi:hypothetical protein